MQGHHPLLSQSLDAVLRAFHQTSLVVANTALPDTSPQFPAHSNRCISIAQASWRIRAFLRGKMMEYGSLLLENHFIDKLRAVNTIEPSHSQAFHPLATAAPSQAVQMHHSHVIGHHADGRICKGCAHHNADVKFTPLVTPFRVMLLALPLDFTQNFDLLNLAANAGLLCLAGAGAGAAKNLDIKISLTPAEGAEV